MHSHIAVVLPKLFEELSPVYEISYPLHPISQQNVRMLSTDPNHFESQRAKQIMLCGSVTIHSRLRVLMALLE